MSAITFPRRFIPVFMSAAVLAGSAGGATTAAARGGELDAGFGRGGLVATDLGAGDDYALAAALQADGKIVVAGIRGTPGTFRDQWVVGRYNVDGSVDTAFAQAGIAATAFGTGSSAAYDVAVDASGKIVAAGPVADESASDTTRQIGLARYNPDGSLDGSFGAGGKVVTGFAPLSNEWATSLAFANDGKIVIGGGARGGGLPPGNFLVARYNADGSLDTSFGSGGKAIVDFGTLAEVRGLAVDAAGKVVAVGQTFAFSGNGVTPGKAFVAARFNPDGSLDTSFGGGKVATSFSGDVYFAGAFDVVIDAQGRIVVAGTVGQGNARATVVRYRPDGSLDATFGTGGKVVREVPEGGSGASAVALDGRGRILVAGDAAVGSSLDFELTRVLPNGSPDPSFGDDGVVDTDVGGGTTDSAADLVLAADGKIVAVGASGGRIAIARYLPTYCVVPNVKRKTLPAAKAALAKAGCSAGTIARAWSGTVPAGRVVSQGARVGARLVEGARVGLVLSRGRRR